jgi:uncharacterized protein DUF4845
MSMVRNERGLTMIGFLFVAVVVVTAALVGFRVLPAYVEYYSIQKTLQAALDESPEATLAQVRRAFDRRIGANYIDSVSPSDVVVTKDGNVIKASVSWQRILHIIGNASILLEFDASAQR